MIPRLVSSRLPVLAYHPPKVCDTAYMQALDRAGVLPILDSEFLTNTEGRYLVVAIASEVFQNAFDLRLPPLGSRSHQQITPPVKQDLVLACGRK